MVTRINPLSCARPIHPPLFFIFPRDRYLFPSERDAILLSMYIRCLVDGSVQKERASLMYWIAVHHLASLLFSGAGAAGDEADTREPLDAEVKQKCLG